MADEAQKIERLLRHGLDVYVYFNNDAQGHAVNNARILGAFLEVPSIGK